MIFWYLFVLHFIADFLLQSREMGKKKSKELKWWAAHISIQFLVFLFGLWDFVGPDVALKFAALNAIIHGVIDATIWNVYGWFVFQRTFKEASQGGIKWQKKKHVEWLKKNWSYWEDHWFYTTIGFDQLLHTLTLLAVWNYL